jgi:hypothetical protein
MKHNKKIFGLSICLISLMMCAQSGFCSTIVYVSSTSSTNGSFQGATNYFNVNDGNVITLDTVKYYYAFPFYHWRFDGRVDFPGYFCNKMYMTISTFSKCNYLEVRFIYTDLTQENFVLLTSAGDYEFNLNPNKVLSHVRFSILSSLFLGKPTVQIDRLVAVS